MPISYDSDLRSQYLDNTSVHIGSDGGDTMLFANLRDGQSLSDGKVTVPQTRHDATYAYLNISFSRK